MAVQWRKVPTARCHGRRWGFDLGAAATRSSSAVSALTIQFEVRRVFLPRLGLC